MTVWQISAGSDPRDYVQEFLSRGLAFVGGKSQIAAFAHVGLGDLLVLKRGLKEIVAIGEVITRGESHRGIGDKTWLRDFDGWDLESYVHVQWRKPSVNVSVKGLRMGTIARINQTDLRQASIDAFASGVPVGDPAPEPGQTTRVEDNEILFSLIWAGLSPRLAEELMAEFVRIRSLAHYYRACQWSDIREHETRTFLVVPLLKALGWAEQKMKIELAVPGGRIDLACFRRPYRRTDGHENAIDCELIIETKGYAQGLNLAPEQVLDYAKFYPSCRAVVVTNGYCYKVYSKVEGVFSTLPSCYVNLLNPQDRYPLDPINTDGCCEVLRQLLPS